MEQGYCRAIIKPKIEKLETLYAKYLNVRYTDKHSIKSDKNMCLIF